MRDFPLDEHIGHRVTMAETTTMTWFVTVRDGETILPYDYETGDGHGDYVLHCWDGHDEVYGRIPDRAELDFG
jgi:hypothetical protein